MKIIHGLFFLGLIFVGCNKKLIVQPQEKFVIDVSNRDLIGVWKFVERLGDNGEKLDTIWYGRVYEIASGPLIVFNEDGTYSMKFTPKNIDCGKWRYVPKTSTLCLSLLINPNDYIGKDLISKGLAIKYDDGNYYEKIEDKILKVSADTLYYLDHANYKMVYEKVK